MSLEQAMAEMAGEMDGVDDDNPQQVARMMRRLFDGAGIELGPGMREAMRRMETGEDPDRIEEELQDVLEGEEQALFGSGSARGGLKALRRRLTPPRVDPTLYEL